MWFFPVWGCGCRRASDFSLGRAPHRLGDAFFSETWDRFVETEKILVSTFLFSHAIVVYG